jgi:hypothetical protein
MRACAIFCELGGSKEYKQRGLMAKFGRFEFAEVEPSETYD